MTGGIIPEPVDQSPGAVLARTALITVGGMFVALEPDEATKFRHIIQETLEDGGFWAQVVTGYNRALLGERVGFLPKEPE